jgi:transcriptional regulator with XRE-family HTH domain
MELGIEIARLRSKLNLTQRQFATKLHTSVVNVSSWEKGITYPDIQMTKRIADVLNISACDLLKSVEINDEVVEAEADDKQYKKFVYANFLSLLFISIALLFVILLSDLQPNSEDNLTAFFIIHTLIIIVSSLLVVASIGLFIYNICHFHNYLKDGYHTKTYNISYMVWIGIYILIFILDIVGASLFINLL